MRAVVLSRFGPPDVLELAELASPTPAPGELLVRVLASGTNPVDAKIRAAGSWARIVLPCVIGYDASGVVEAVGTGVKEFAPGDEVFFTPEIFETQLGTYAELTTVPAALVAPKPQRLSHEEAAAVPLAGGTAWEAVVRRLALRVGETILIHGGAGGVGSFAVQIARALGARVLATASPRHHDAVRALGADRTFDYADSAWTQQVLRETGGAGVDACFDTSGRNLIASLPCVRPFGRLATILGFSGDLTQAYLRNQAVHGVFLTRERKRLLELTPLLERGLVKPLVDLVLPLDRIQEAHVRLDSGHGRGKIVVRMG
jgi:NADPH2:quinone reductase